MADVDAQRRHEMGAFLRKARARVKPDSVGITEVGKRKTPGLRREEVATLAGMSPVWYTWLEQGRNIQASVDVLTALARALRLTKSETTYLLRIGRPSPVETGDHPSIPDAMKSLLNSAQIPACLADRSWNVIGFNRLADLFFGISEIPLEDRNPLKVIWQLGERSLVEDWPVVARRLVAEFRASYALNTNDPQFLRIAEQLSARSADFAEWWDEQFVDVSIPMSRLVFRHPLVGPVAIHRVCLRPLWSPEIALHMFPPVDQEASQRLERLITDDTKKEG